MKRLVTITAAAALLAVPATVANAEVPMYAASYAGPGMSTTMNDVGVVIGNDSPTYPGQPWVNDGTGPRPLPLPSGTVAARVSDINDAGQIVGTGYVDGQLTSDRPLIWTPNGSGYDVEPVPLPGGATRGTGVAINESGQILASGFLIGGVLPTYQAYVVDGSNTVPLGLSGAITINDNGLVLTNNTLFDYTTMTDLGLPAPPDGVRPIAMYPADLNDNDQIIVTMLTTIISYTRYEVIGIYTVGTGWTHVTGVGTNFSAGAMNDRGDFLVNNRSSCATMVYLQGEGYYCPSSLLDPAGTDWTVGRTLGIANDRSLLAVGSNSITGDSGVALMRPIGALPAPAAPIDVAAIPHEPTAQQNFVSIDLSWAPADTLTRSYVVERHGPDDATFTELASTTNRFYRDMAIVGGETYTYRVVAVGLAGRSEPSAAVSALAPAPGDREAPVITSISLQDGDVVSGIVQIDVTATDNVGVRLITVNAPGMRQRCDVYDSPIATCRWDTRDLPAGPASVYVTASDAMGNGTFDIVTVTVEANDSGGKGGGKGANGNGKGGGGKGRNP